LQPAFRPKKFRRKYGKANGNDYECWPWQNDKGNPDESHRPANDSDDNTFGDTKIRNRQAPRIPSAFVRLHRFGLRLMRFVASMDIGNSSQRLRATRQKSAINPS